ncbi:hypothetical protein [Cellulomonas sp. SLBN-39]|uniref:DUF7878 domain-containing protein n=1 Tax=Cellulomonas sp. SLBN-39 TaxID=2768446 RepID=UPI001150E827|nr:hypothetical protein [Cellulomonas sp. SLBN-39]TQL04602.1 hypothetical protein FBY24_3723 [Cellulomonas sp. SLBN-39]
MAGPAGGEATRLGIEFTELDLQPAGGDTLADHLVALEGNFVLTVDGAVIYQDDLFPIAELARCLTLWLDAAGGDDFAFDSMSVEEVGALYAWREHDGLLVGSTLAPEHGASLVSEEEFVRAARSFISAVRARLVEMRLDTDMILGGWEMAIKHEKRWPARPGFFRRRG